MQNTPPPRRFDRIYSAGFLLFMFVLLLSFLSLPLFPLANISEHFRWRKSLIELYANVRFQLGDRVYNEAVIGKEDWIFYTGKNSMKDYQITHATRKKLLADLVERLDRLSLSLKSEGTTLVVVIVPNKSTIYSQYMPDEIPVLGREREINEFVRALQASGKTPVVDLENILREASQSQQVFYKTDTHWTDLGAYYGYVEIMKVLSARYPQLKPRSLSDFDYVQAQDSTRDLSRIMGLLHHTEANWFLVPKFETNLTEAKEPLPNEPLYIRTVMNQNRSLPSLLVYHDSFYLTLTRFIEPHFSRIKTIPFSEENNTWSLDWIAREKPDIVIIEFVERNLDDSLQILLPKNVKIP